MCPFKISPVSTSIPDSRAAQRTDKARHVLQETFLSTATQTTSTSRTSTVVKESRHETWSRRVDQALIDQMSETEKKRQK